MPPGRSFRLRLARVAFSGWFSPRGHSIRRLRYCVLVAHESTFLRSLRSAPITELHRYCGRSDSRSAGSSRQMPMSLVCDSPRRVSLIHARGPCDHSASTHPMVSGRRFVTLPFSATGFRRQRARRSGLRHWDAGSSPPPGRIEFVILRTDRSPPAAPHPASWRRSCSRLQAGERLPEEDFHLSDHTRFQAHIPPTAVGGLLKLNLTTNRRVS